MADELPQETSPAQTELVNVRDPDTLEIGSIPVHQLPDLVQQGYQPVSNDEAKAYVQQQKYGGVGQTLLTGLEGAGVGATFGLSTGLERALGVDPEDIQGRREANPLAHGIGEAAGLTGSAFIPGAGEANLLSRASEGAATAVGLGEASGTLAKLGSHAVKSAVETMMVQGGDEVSKMLASDPHQSVQTAITDIGLSGLIGGGFGAGLGVIHPLWNATVGDKVGTLLKAVRDKAGGIEGTIPDVLGEALQRSGINMPPEIKAGLSQDPQVRGWFKTLEQSDTTSSGQKFQEAYKNVRKEAGDTLVQAMGKSPEALKDLSEISNYETGKKVGKTLASEFETRVNPLAERFETLREKYKNIELPEDVQSEVSRPSSNPYLPNETETMTQAGTTSQIADKIGQLAIDQGWTSSPSSDMMKEVHRVMKELPAQKTLDDLTKYSTQIGNNTYDFTNPQLTRAGQLMKNIVKDAESDVLMQKLSEEAPELIAEHQEARSAWKQVAQLKDELDSRLHVGGGNSPGSFIKNLKEMSEKDGESVVRRLSGKGDANLLQLLKEQFPQTAEAIRQYHLDDVLGRAAAKAKPEESINAKALLTSIDKMSPELRDFVLPSEAMQKISGIGQILEHFDSMPHNFSNTARTVDKLWSYLPGSALGLASMLTGHNPAIGVLMAPLTKWIGRDIPDAVRLGLLKFLGSSQPIESEGFKSMVDFIQHTIKSEGIINKAAQNLLKSTSMVLPQALLPNEKDRKKLDEQLMKLKTKPEDLMNIGGKTAHYLPDHGTAMGETAANAVNYLNGLRPSTDKRGPLDSEVKPSASEKAAFNNALDIAQQPLLVLQKIREGTLTPQDMQHLGALYPKLHEKLVQRVMQEMTNTLSKDGQVPYKTRIGLSLFMGQGLDSTLTPEAIRATQPQPTQSMPSQQGAQPRMKHSMTALNKFPGMMQTPSQAREAERSR